MNNDYRSINLQKLQFCDCGIPYCPNTNRGMIPERIITWTEARTSKDHDAWVSFFEDDFNFEKIWGDPDMALDVLRKFGGTFCPDFSTFCDFPDALQLYNTYRMRLFGAWLGEQGIPVINTVRWSMPYTYAFAFSGIPKDSIFIVSTCGGNPRLIQNRTLFDQGLKEAVRILRPHTILVYGSANHPCFRQLKNQGIKIIAFDTRKKRTMEAYK